MTTKTTIRALRMISSFALLGAVVAGAFFGWGEHSADAARAWGAGLGATVGVLTSLQALHIL